MKKRMFSNEATQILKFLLFGVLGLIMCFVFVSCENYQINSRWKNRDIVIDGQSEDWLDTLTYVEEFNVSVGMANDTDFFYICAVVENPLVRMRVMRQGLTVWFDPEGGRKKSLGIRFPLGTSGRRERPVGIEEESDMEKLKLALSQTLNELEILGPNRDDVLRMKKQEANGVDVVINVSGALLVYELKVPLNKSPDRPFAINIQSGSDFGIGIETSPRSRDIETSSSRRTTRGLGSPRSGGNPGMGRPGSMGGMPGAGQPMMPRKLKLWMSVSLSQESRSF